jgi:hypothetical protein
LTAVITTAIRDAVAPAPKKEGYERRDVLFKAREAIAWLFDDQSVCPLYAGLIGLDAPAIRRALVASRAGGDARDQADIQHDRPQDAFRPSGTLAHRASVRLSRNSLKIHD